MVRKPKLLSSIRAKLFSAVAMLLVAVIMVVSSTYAWFTLSTAPEVTGMTTAIGANGSLEMALRYSNVDETTGAVTVGDVLNGLVEDPDDPLVSNKYWGNMVDVLDTAYGLHEIIMYPSTLNYASSATHIASDAFLMTPVYGDDGRVSDVEANTVVGTYNGTGFIANDLLGVRGVGTSSGLSDRQLAYRSAAAVAASSLSQARAITITSLTTYGNALASAAVSLAMESNAVLTAADVTNINAILTELDKAVAKLDDAYRNAVLAYASSKVTTDSTLWSTVDAAVSDATITTESIMAMVTSLPTSITGGYAHYKTIVSNLTAAHDTLEPELAKLDENGALKDGETINTNTVKGALSQIVESSNLKINGQSVADFKSDIGNQVGTVMKEGLQVTMAEGSGIYADIAKQTDDFSVQVTIDSITYQDTTVPNIPATMKTSSESHYSDAIVSDVTSAGAPEDEVGATKPMTEMYGYIIDLAFRTNASASNLLLQAAPTDRIYDNNGNDQTQGSGSFMEFTATSTDLSGDQIKDLMGSIRIVFFETAATADGYKILKTASLDATNATVENGAYKATVVLDDGTDVIAALTQNTQYNISVLVYLEGSTIENGDVAASVASSLNGKLNLQFASDANLVPMENGDLHQQAVTPDAGENTPAQEGEEAGN